MNFWCLRWVVLLVRDLFLPLPCVLSLRLRRRGRAAVVILGLCGSDWNSAFAVQFVEKTCIWSV